MPSILFEIKDSVAFITLNRPEKFNAFNREMALLMQETLDACKSDEVRCVYITGSGKAFCAGQDLAEVVDPKGPGIQRILSEHYNPIVTRIRELEKPVIAAVNGVAAGAGANLAICCDIALAARSASFIQSFSKIGLVPDTGGSFFLPRLIGWQKAAALMMLGEKVAAEDAEKMGMIYKSIPDESFAEETLKLATTLSKMPTKALYLIKKELQWSSTHTIYEQLQNEDKLQQRAAQTEDYKEGVAAFLEKRTPVFKGK
jgi:2-(1,2-epoxy-1,2-dihydrophenyl)acetyl-CoA isomerase